MQKDDFTVWLENLHRYEEIDALMRKDKQARWALKDHPGVKFMQKGLKIFWGVIFALAILGG